MTNVLTKVREHKLSIALFLAAVILQFWDPWKSDDFNELWSSLVSNESGFKLKIMTSLFFSGVKDWIQMFYSSLRLQSGYGIYTFFLSAMLFTLIRSYTINSTHYSNSSGNPKILTILIDYFKENAVFIVLSRLTHLVAKLSYPVIYKITHWDSGKMAIFFHVLTAIILCSIVLLAIPPMSYFISMSLNFFISFGLLNLVVLILELLHIPIFILNSIIVFSTLTGATLALSISKTAYNRSLEFVVSNTKIFLPDSIYEYLLNSLFE